MGVQDDAMLHSGNAGRKDYWKVMGLLTKTINVHVGSVAMGTV